MAKKKKKKEITLSPELALCAGLMTDMFDGIFKDINLEDFHCSDDYYICITPELAAHLYEHCGCDFDSSNDDDKEAWIKDITGQYMYVSYFDAPVTIEELMLMDNIGSSSDWQIDTWGENVFNSLYWWVDEIIDNSATMFGNYEWRCLLQCFGLMSRMVKSGKLTIEKAWGIMNDQKTNDGCLSFEGWKALPMPEDLTLDNFMHYVFKDIFETLYGNMELLSYISGIGKEYFWVLNQELVDKYLERESDNKYIRLSENLGKYVYASWGGDSFTVDEMRNFYKWNGLCIFTEDLLLARYRDLPAYFIPGREVKCSNFTGTDIIDYMLIAHKLAILNGETDEDFSKRFCYIRNI